MSQTEREIYSDSNVTVYSYNEQQRKSRQQMERRLAVRKYIAERRSRRRQALVLALLMSMVVIIFGTCAYAAGNRRPELTIPTPIAPEISTAEQTLATHSTPAAPSLSEQPEESVDYENLPVWEWPEDVLIESGYYSDAVPMPYEYQGYMRRYCEEYNCPYPLALAVAEVESNFDMGAVGLVGEVGIMQLNPGPLGEYHDNLQAATGLDPMTAEGNIAAGCYLLGKYLAIYGDTTRAVMAYHMGQAGAAEAWASGQSSSYYSNLVMDAVQKWSNTVHVWNRY